MSIIPCAIAPVDMQLDYDTFLLHTYYICSYSNILGFADPLSNSLCSLIMPCIPILHDNSVLLSSM
jgi:hypothetical protein